LEFYIDFIEIYREHSDFVKIGQITLLEDISTFTRIFRRIISGMRKFPHKSCGES